MRYWKKLPYALNRKLKPLRLVTREEWGALPVDERSRKDRLTTINHPVPRVIVAYTEDKMCNTEEECKERLRELQKRDMDEGLPDIRYNFLMGGDGNAYEGRGWLYCPKESGSYPEWYGESYEIAHIGFHCLHLPTYMAKAAWDVVKLGINQNYVVPEGTIVPDLFKFMYDWEEIHKREGDDEPRVMEIPEVPDIRLY